MMFSHWRNMEPISTAEELTMSTLSHRAAPVSAYAQTKDSPKVVMSFVVSAVRPFRGTHTIHQ